MKKKSTVKKKLQVKEFKVDKKDGKTVRIILKPSRSSAVLASFALYCSENPQQRFWQALRNWSESAFIYSRIENGSLIDTFYREGRLE